MQIKSAATKDSLKYELRNVKVHKKPIGYRMNFADWEARYKREFDRGDIIDINNEVCVNKQTIQSVENSIYDKKLGDLTDTDKDVREFSCDCGNTYGHFYEGMICPDCGTPVVSKFNIDIKRVGWINLGKFFIINPNAYELICKCIGRKNLQKILSYDIQIDIDGNMRDTTFQNNTEVSKTKGSKRSQTIPYQNSGIFEFRKNFEQILSYYSELKGTQEYAQYLIDHKDEIFSTKIPVSSVYIRPTFASSKKRSVSFDKLNATYVKILSDASLLRRTFKKEVELKRSLNVLFDIQTSLQQLYADTIKTKLSGKTKIIRSSILGNRCNFSARMVIRSMVGPYMGMDKVEMSYKGFLELNYLEVINCLMRGYGNDDTHNFSNQTVYEIMEYVQKAQYSNELDPVIWRVCNLILKNRPHNAVAVLRPPSLALGSLQYFEVCRITPDAQNKTLALPLSSLTELNGDFDGDTLSVFWLKEKQVIDAYREGISPKRLLIDRAGDVAFNTSFSLIKDEITSLITALTI